MNQEIKLPPLPETEYLLGIPARPYESELISSDSAWDDSAMQAYATAAVELYRAQQGEPTMITPSGPAWHDAPTCAGLWVCRHNITRHVTAYEFSEVLLKRRRLVEKGRWFGPIHEDTK